MLKQIAPNPQTEARNMSTVSESIENFHRDIY